MAELSGSGALAEALSPGAGGACRGIAAVCSAHPLVLQAAFEHALATGETVLVESTSNQVNQEGGYTGLRPADFAAFVRGLAAENGLAPERLVLGGDHLGPHPWRSLAADAALSRAQAMVRAYVAAGYEKVHLDASTRCADDPPTLPARVAAERTALLAAAAEHAAEEASAAPPFYVVGTEVPAPGGLAADHAGPLPTRPEDAEATLELTRAAFSRRGLGRALSRVRALVVQPGVEFADDEVFAYRPEGAAGLTAVADAHPPLVFEAHSTDYQDEAALRALVHDRFAVLKVGPELTFALREAAFALEAVEVELLGGRAGERLSGLRDALEEAMQRDPRHWRDYHRGADEHEQRLSRRFGLSDRSRYYWPAEPVQRAFARLVANLAGRRVPRGLLSQYLPDGVVAAAAPLDPAALVRAHVRRVLARYARACRPAPEACVCF